MRFGPNHAPRRAAAMLTCTALGLAACSTSQETPLPPTTTPQVQFDAEEFPACTGVSVSPSETDSRTYRFSITTENDFEPGMWNIVGASFDYGDRSEIAPPEPDMAAEHRYEEPGEYTVQGYAILEVAPNVAMPGKHLHDGAELPCRPVAVVVE